MKRSTTETVVGVVVAIFLAAFMFAGIGAGLGIAYVAFRCLVNMF